MSKTVFCLVFMLLVTCVSFDSVAATSLTDFVISIESDHANGTSEANLRSALCSSDKRLPEFIAAAREEGIQEPEDFLNLLRLMWCGEDVEKNFDRARSRLNLSKAKMKDDQITQEALWETPYSFSLEVTQKGTHINMSTDREGGGDEIGFKLSNHQWKIVRLKFGGAC
jgi:hypothetical protein